MNSLAESGTKTSPHARVAHVETDEHKNLVIPAQAGIHGCMGAQLDSGLRRNDEEGRCRKASARDMYAEQYPPALYDTA
jgi:hypothetical protein